jgi:hypothetical protein
LADFRDYLDIKVAAWDQPGAGVAMEAGLTPQEAIKEGLTTTQSVGVQA